MLLIGPVGSHLTTLCKLALHVADIPSHTIDTSRHTLFLDSLRAALRMTGAEGKKLALVFNVRILRILPHIQILKICETILVEFLMLILR